MLSWTSVPVAVKEERHSRIVPSKKVVLKKAVLKKVVLKKVVLKKVVLKKVVLKKVVLKKCKLEYVCRDEDTPLNKCLNEKVNRKYPVTETLSWRSMLVEEI